MLSGNKGEWSEIYTFFKLLGDKKVYGGDMNLNKIENLFYPILKILREEKSGKFEYHIDQNVVLVFGGENEIRVPIETFSIIANQLFENIKNTKGTFSLPEIEEFMSSIHCSSIKAKSLDKTDIKLVIHDLRTGMQPILGFSIKSKLGSPSTLLNSNKDSTNFLYQIHGINDDIMNEVNQFIEFKDKFEFLGLKKSSTTFITPVLNVFKNNLIYIDSSLPDIIGNVVLKYYSTPHSKISDLVAIIKEENPLNFDYSYDQNFYEHKIKRLLTDAALGLKTTKPWRGVYEAKGGYIIVKENGDVICYHIYDKNQFEDYLFNYTKLETPSTTRHLFGDVFKIDDNYFIKLNLQIRFV